MTCRKASASFPLLDSLDLGAPPDLMTSKPMDS